MHVNDIYLFMLNRVDEILFGELLSLSFRFKPQNSTLLMECKSDKETAQLRKGLGEYLKECALDIGDTN